MPSDFAAWAALSDSQKIYLAETSVLRLADGVVLPLYLANLPFKGGERFFLPCIKGLPRLTRKSNDTLSPNHVPTWGEMEISIEPDYRPDAGRTATWADLLSEAYNFVGRPLIIKIGGEGWAYGDFQTILDGRIGGLAWTDISVTLTLYDKAQDLVKKVPSYELPVSPWVIEESYNQPVPRPLGRIKNYKPVLITDAYPGSYNWRYALADCVIESLDAVREDNVQISTPGNYIWVPKDLFPAAKNGEGAAQLIPAGPYTGALFAAEWLIQIDSVAAGPAVGQATFRWSMAGGAPWIGEGLPTWNLTYDPTTLVKAPAVGTGTMAVSGDYTGITKENYKVKITVEGYIGGPTNAQFEWSPNNGATWYGPVEIVDTNPIPLNEGLSVAFAGASAGSFMVDDTWTWNFKDDPIPLADGVTVQFLSKAEALAQGVDPSFLTADDDFALYDEWRFILGSSLLTVNMMSGVNVCADVQGMKSPVTGAYVNTAGEIIQAILVSGAGWDGAADFDLPALAAFIAAIPYELGLLVDTPTEISQIIDDLLAGIPALYTITLAGKFFITEIAAPAGPAVLELTDVEILGSPEGRVDDANIYRRVYLHYDRNYNADKNPQNVTDIQRLQWLQQEWRLISARDEEVLLTYPLAKDLGPIDTALVQRAEAAALALKLLNLYKSPHRYLAMVSKVQSYLCDLGNKILVNRSLFPATLHTITGMELDFTESRGTTTLWR